jgi:SAM-dependent methyltransferase
MGYRIDRLNLSIKENGFLWTMVYLLKRATHWNIFSDKLKSLEEKRKYPGWNSVNQNKLTWNNWNWNELGEEWTKSEEWKNKLVSEIIMKLITDNSSIIEIGPGGGRWSEFLLKKAVKLNLVDISEKCLELCEKRFGKNSNISYNLINDVKFNFAESNSTDVVFSYDVFVHIDKKQITQYFVEFARVLKNPGKIILHYSKVGDKFGEYRSRFTSDDMNELLKKLNLNLIAEYDVETLETNKGNFFEVIAIIGKNTK